MKSWSETIQLSQPLRGVGPLNVTTVDAAREAGLQEQLQASYERGRIDGEKALSEQLVQQRAELQELLNGVINSLRQAVPQVVHDTEEAMVTLALEIAQKLVAKMPISARMIEAAVHDALGQLKGTAQYQVCLHPADLKLLQKARSPLLVPDVESKKVRFQGSPDVTRGGCLVQTQFGIIDARRETKFDLLKRDLLA